MHRAKPGSDTKETTNVNTTIALDPHLRHVSCPLFTDVRTNGFGTIPSLPVASTNDSFRQYQSFAAQSYRRPIMSKAGLLTAKSFSEASCGGCPQRPCRTLPRARRWMERVRDRQRHARLRPRWQLERSAPAKSRGTDVAANTSHQSRTQFAPDMFTSTLAPASAMLIL